LAWLASLKNQSAADGKVDLRGGLLCEVGEGGVAMPGLSFPWAKFRVP